MHMPGPPVMALAHIQTAACLVPPGVQHNAAADYYSRNQYSLGGDYAKQQAAQAQQQQAMTGYGSSAGGASGQGGGAYGQQQGVSASMGDLAAPVGEWRPACVQ